MRVSKRQYHSVQMFSTRHEYQHNKSLPNEKKKKRFSDIRSLPPSPIVRSKVGPDVYFLRGLRLQTEVYNYYS